MKHSQYLQGAKKWNKEGGNGFDDRWPRETAPIGTTLNRLLKTLRFPTTAVTLCRSRRAGVASIAIVDVVVAAAGAIVVAIAIVTSIGVDASGIAADSETPDR